MKYPTCFMLHVNDLFERSSLLTSKLLSGIAGVSAG